MTDTGVTFLSCYNTVGHARVRHDPYLPSISVSFQTPGRVELATILAIPLLSRIVSPRFYLILPASSGMFKKFDSERYHQSSHPRWDLAQTHKSKTLACFPSPSYYLLFRGCQTLIFFSFFFPQELARLLVHDVHHAPSRLEFARL